MLLDIPFLMNYLICDQLFLDLVDICLNNTLQILCESFLGIAKIGKIVYSKVPKIWLVKCCMFSFKIAYLAQFSADSNNLDFKM